MSAAAEPTIDVDSSSSSSSTDGEEEEEEEEQKETKNDDDVQKKSQQRQQPQHRQQNVPSSVPVTALGIESARCGGSWSEMPQFSQPGDDWVPLATCRELNSIKSQVGELVARLHRSKKRARKSRAPEKNPDPATAATSPPPPPESQILQAAQPLPADVRKETIRELKEIAERIGAARDSLHECFAEAVRALMIRRANPEILGYGMLLQATPDPPEWARREKVAPERKHKRPPPSADAEKKEPARAPRQLTLDAILGEKLPLRSEHSKKQ